MTGEIQQPVITDGHRLYVRTEKRGVYHEVDTRGQGLGVICSGFVPRPRWRPARLCVYDARSSLTCVNCGRYDMRYAESGERSYCYDQRPRAASKRTREP